MSDRDCSLPKIGPCPKCGGNNVDLYILIPRKGYTAVSIECHTCDYSIQSPSVNTFMALKKHWDFIARMEKSVAAKWNRQTGIMVTQKQITVAEVVSVNVGHGKKKQEIERTESKMKALTVGGFDKALGEAKTNGRAMVVDFWATWCAPCRAMVPILETLEKEYAGRVDFYGVNVAEETALAQQWMVESIPRIFVFFGGVMSQVMGPCSKAELAAVLDELLVVSEEC